MLRITFLEQFKKDFADFPLSSREDLFSIIKRFVEGEKLNQSSLKIFKIDKKLKVYEFRVKDQFGNWRVISVIVDSNELVLIYAFHKKSQELQEKEKKIIRSRIKRYFL
jgi:phage-related protein